jgi:DNA-directed RNA polymerase II subunit RPB7
MFFVKRLRREILMEPLYLGAKLKEHVKHRVMQELEGQCLGRHGFVISVLDVKDEDIEPGLIDNDTGAVNVAVWYTVILLRPYRNQVLDTVVTSASDENGFLTKVGFFILSLTLNHYYPLHLARSLFTFTPRTTINPYSQVGPLVIFVSRHNMPDDVSFDASAGDCWVSEDERVEIREGSLVRVRLIGLNFDAGTSYADPPMWV